jgi:hypothetical protein
MSKPTWRPRTFMPRPWPSRAKAREHYLRVPNCSRPIPRPA